MPTVLSSSRHVSVFLEADCPHGSVSNLLSNKDSLSVRVTRREVRQLLLRSDASPMCCNSSQPESLDPLRAPDNPESGLFK